MTGTMTRSEGNIPRQWFEHGPLSALHNEVDGLMESFFGAPLLRQMAGVRSPGIDVVETDANIEVTTDVPGMSADDVDIEIRNDYLTISGQTTEETRSDDENEKKYHRIERRSGSFSRTIRLPCEVNQNEVQAELKDGVLTVTMPKADVEKPRKISIKG